MKTTHTKAQLAREAESLRQDLRDCSAIARKALKGRALPHEEDEFTEAPTTCLIAEMADEIAELRLALMASKMTPPNAEMTDVNKNGEKKGQCERSRLATGSLPVSRAEALCEEWEVFALALEYNADTHGAETVRLLVKDLRREMGLSYPRQPEENIVHEPTRRTDTSQRTDRSE